MLKVKEAQEIVLRNAIKLNTEIIYLKDSLNKTLASDIFSPVDYPFFNQSAVDGYGIKVTGKKINKFKLIKEIKAGDNVNTKITENEAIRIFTGAKVPASVNAIIMQEYVKVDKQYIYIDDNYEKLINKGANIRKKGEEIKKNELALKKGTILNPVSIAFLLSLGITKVKVVKQPVINIIATGSELLKPEGKLSTVKLGKKFETNGIMLSLLLKNMGIKANYKIVKDDFNSIRQELLNFCSHSDIVIITGGVSVGDYDFTAKAIESIDFNIIFHKVAQKPGKPFLFAKKNNKVIFGLPGNPRAVAICFYQYIYPFIRKSLGIKNPFLREINLKLSDEIIKKDDKKSHINAVRIQDNKAILLNKQNSHMLQSLSMADALWVLDENITKYNKNTMVKVQLIN